MLRVTVSQAKFSPSVEHRSLFFSLYYRTQLAVSVNHFLFLLALQTCCRATQKGPGSGGREFP